MYIVNANQSDIDRVSIKRTNSNARALRNKEILVTFLHKLLTIGIVIIIKSVHK